MEISCGSTSEHDVDEASYGEHKNRYDGENPKDPEPLIIFIGVLFVAERCGHRDLPVKDLILSSANDHPRM
jgi:hypothetical protein